MISSVVFVFPLLGVGSDPEGFDGALLPSHRLNMDPWAILLKIGL